MSEKADPDERTDYDIPDERIDAATSVQEDSEDYFVEEKIADLHTQTDFSDGLQTLGEVIDEAYNEGFYLVGVSDHSNIGSEDKFYESSFYSQNEDLENYEGRVPFSQVYEDRFEALEDNVEERLHIVLWQNADREKLLEDFYVLKECAGECSIDNLREMALHYNMVVMNATEPDFNPIIEDKSSEDEIKQEVENYVAEIKEFLSEGVRFSHLNQAVHDVYVGGELRYLKRPKLFSDLSIDEKESTWHDYRKKLFELSKHLPETLEELNLSMSLVHPTIIERNEELREVTKCKKAEEEIEKFVYGLNESNIPWSGIMEENSEYFDISTNQNLSVEIGDLLNKREIEELDDREILRKYWKDIIPEIEKADNLILEINGKHLTRYEPSVAWELYSSFIFGSDKHREGELKRRFEKLRELDVDAEIETPLHRLEEKEDDKSKKSVSGIN